ncbi:hypothetical protein [Eubacterium maltosivorans]|nr:hypothetical protein [Eubacterium maltosivorans]
MIMSEACQNENKKSSKIKGIVMIAICIRVIVLLFIAFFANNMSEGFVGSSTYYDDYRYEKGAEYYAQNATSLIDVSAFMSAFASVGDWVGNKLSNPFESTPLWYWIVCILTYLTKTVWSIRILNILLASFTIVYVFRFTDLIYGDRTATKASYLLALLPYPVIFSCFSYKDQLVMFITFYLLYIAEKYRMSNVIKKKDIFAVLIFSLMLMLTRSGFSILLFLVCFVIAFVKKLTDIKKYKKKLLAIGFFGIITICILLIQYSDIIIYKFEYYIIRHENTLDKTTIAYLTINGIRDIYKLPFTYIFSMIMPIEMFGEVTSWYSIVANFNIIMCPISVGAALYVFKKKPDKLVYWCCLMLYIFSIITSINIFRHYYSLIPFSLIFFSDYWCRASGIEKLICGLVSLTYATLLIVFYGVLQ